ncbi:MAG: ATP-dependent zinc protease [Gammaproteobacteria bacterium]|nr:ATP-dependent zinc protease [Gammaproteobacteria bacterium]NNJ84413.1 ATP-dependent zinc protease [Gammaproteobacteria bacterium]
MEKHQKRPKNPSLHREIIGWREWVAFPDIAIPEIKAKVDTGARSSAIHANRIVPFERDGVLWVDFEVYPLQKNNHTRVSCSARVSDHRQVRSSSGHNEERYVVTTKLKIGNQSYPIEITLTNRDQMGFRVLLGRTAIRRHFLVNSGRSFLYGKLPEKYF